MEFTWTNETSGMMTLKANIVGEQWTKAQSKAFNKLHQSLAIPGFRKGKVPANIAKKQINEGQILKEATDSLLNEIYQEAVKEANVKPALQPSVTIEKIDNESLELLFNITLPPEVELGEYKNLEIPKEEATITDEEVEAEIVKLQDESSQMQIKEDGAVKEGDTVTIDFVGYIDGTPFAGGEANNFDLVIGSNTFISGFEEQLVSKKAGEEIDVNVVFPDNYPEIGGQAAVFKVKINEIKEKVLPAIDDNLAIDANVDGVETLEQLKNHYRQTLLDSKTKKLENERLDSLINTIVGNAKIVIAETLINEEIDHRLNEVAENLKKNNMTLEMYCSFTKTSVEEYKESVRKDSQKSYEITSVLRKIAEVENIKVTNEDIEEEISKLATANNLGVEDVRNRLMKQNIFNEFISQLHNNKLVDFLKTANNY